jgi:acyl-CoA thioester hydrolase
LTAFVHRLRVRYNECDAQGIVFNANHFAYFDITLTELWREAFGSYDAVVESGTDVLVARAEADFHKSPHFDDELELHFSIEKLGNSSMASKVEERRGEDLLVTGRMVHVFVDAKTFQKKPIPDDLRERLSAYVG